MFSHLSLIPIFHFICNFKGYDLFADIVSRVYSESYLSGAWCFRRYELFAYSFDFFPVLDKRIACILHHEGTFEHICASRIKTFIGYRVYEFCLFRADSYLILISCKISAYVRLLLYSLILIARIFMRSDYITVKIELLICYKSALDELRIELEGYDFSTWLSLRRELRGSCDRISILVFKELPGLLVVQAPPDFICESGSKIVICDGILQCDSPCLRDECLSVEFCISLQKRHLIISKWTGVFCCELVAFKRKHLELIAHRSRCFRRRNDHNVSADRSDGYVLLIFDGRASVFDELRNTVPDEVIEYVVVDIVAIRWVHTLLINVTVIISYSVLRKVDAVIQYLLERHLSLTFKRICRRFLKAVDPYICKICLFIICKTDVFTFLPGIHLLHDILWIVIGKRIVLPVSILGVPLSFAVGNDTVLFCIHFLTVYVVLSFTGLLVYHYALDEVAVLVIDMILMAVIWNDVAFSVKIEFHIRLRLKFYFICFVLEWTVLKHVQCSILRRIFLHPGQKLCSIIWCFRIRIYPDNSAAVMTYLVDGFDSASYADHDDRWRSIGIIEESRCGDCLCDLVGSCFDILELNDPVSVGRLFYRICCYSVVILYRF